MEEKSQIPIYQLIVHPKNLHELKSDIWTEEPIPAVLKIGKKRYDIDFSFRGSHTRKMKKKSYNIQFISPQKFYGAKEIHLNAEYKDPSLLRNKLSLDFFSMLGALSPVSRFVFITINAKNQGVYLQLESVDEQFLQKRQLPKGSIFYAVDGDANFSLMSDLDKKVKNSLLAGYEAKVLQEGDDAKLEELIYKINTLSNHEFSSEIKKYLDVEKYLCWLIGIICTQNYDGFVHNYALYRNSESGQFEIIPWDYDATWGRDVNGRVMEHDYVRVEGFNTLTARLLNVPDIRKGYVQKFEKVLQEAFATEILQPIVYKHYEQIRPHVLKDPYMTEKVKQFDAEPEFILKFVQKRGDYIKEFISSLE
ncbi:CotH kinase family protein [Bacillus songklensis]|uniref:CotH kinase family protein n=1 Tax=Bacillus songklensis TaxID=1069116 RepID=A0ABV8B3L5_9BACI